jgi:hypothetical protein
MAQGRIFLACAMWLKALMKNCAFVMKLTYVLKFCPENRGQIGLNFGL